MPERRYPARPIVGVGGVVFIDQQVVLVRRRHPPLAVRWSLPGGAVELGETLHEGLQRELQEETRLQTRVGPLIELLDRITRDSDGCVRYHYVLADFLCHRVSGTLKPGSDADTVVLADPDDLGSYDLTDEAQTVIASARRLR